MTCKNCGHDKSFRKLNKDGSAFIVLCSRCGRLIRMEIRPVIKAASGN